MQIQFARLFWRAPIGRLRWMVRMAMAVAMLAAAGPVAAGSSNDLTAFLAAYRCDVVERLQMIHADPTPKKRYLVIGLLDPPEAYVQCLFVENDSKILCEAESGFYRQKAGEPRQFRVTP